MTNSIRTVYWENDAVVFIDQRLLPGVETVSYTHLTLPTTERV